MIKPLKLLSIKAAALRESLHCLNIGPTAMKTNPSGGWRSRCAGAVFSYCVTLHHFYYRLWLQ